MFLKRKIITKELSIFESNQILSELSELLSYTYRSLRTKSVSFYPGFAFSFIAGGKSIFKIMKFTI